MKKLRFFTVITLLSFLFAGLQAQDTKEIYMEGHDNMKFTVENITVKPGYRKSVV